MLDNWRDQSNTLTQIVIPAVLSLSLSLSLYSRECRDSVHKLHRPCVLGRHAVLVLYSHHALCSLYIAPLVFHFTPFPPWTSISHRCIHRTAFRGLCDCFSELDLSKFQLQVTVMWRQTPRLVDWQKLEIPLFSCRPFFGCHTGSQPFR